jgi:AcrR family transcriptional regulator
MTTSQPTAGQSPVVRAAVDRALSKQRDDAAREVEAFLDAALRVAERVAPTAPRVADIVAEAGSSNQAFYRYFAGKDDLMQSVYERGITRLHSYLEHQLEKVDDPAEQVEAWIRGVLTQVTDRRAARQSAAVARQLSRPDDGEAEGAIADVRELLLGAVRRRGSAEPELDAVAIYALVFAVLGQHGRRGSAPSKAECDHLVRFCLRGLQDASGR